MATTVFDKKEQGSEVYKNIWRQTLYKREPGDEVLALAHFPNSGNRAQENHIWSTYTQVNNTNQGPPPGGTPDFKWQGWSNGGKIKNPKKPLDQNSPQNDPMKNLFAQLRGR